MVKTVLVSPPSIGHYTHLLESSQKSDAAQIQKYFNKLNPQSLVNIHATTDAAGVDNSFIKIVMNDDSDFEVSHQNTAINAQATKQKKACLLAIF
jgi:hypothetical protein